MKKGLWYLSLFTIVSLFPQLIFATPLFKPLKAETRGLKIRVEVRDTVSDGTEVLELGYISFDKNAQGFNIILDDPRDRTHIIVPIPTTAENHQELIDQFQEFVEDNQLKPETMLVEYNIASEQKGHHSDEDLTSQKCEWEKRGIVCNVHRDSLTARLVTGIIYDVASPNSQDANRLLAHVGLQKISNKLSDLIEPFSKKSKGQLLIYIKKIKPNDYDHFSKSSSDQEARDEWRMLPPELLDSRRVPPDLLDLRMHPYNSSGVKDSLVLDVIIKAQEEARKKREAEEKRRKLRNVI